MKTARTILAIAIVGTVIIWIVTEYVVVQYVGSTFAFTIAQGDVWIVYDLSLVNMLARLRYGPGFAFIIMEPWEWFPLPEIDENGVNVPFWLMLIVMLPPWFLLDRAYRKRRRREAVGCCIQCGYDLTGNESGICSECGCGAIQEESIY